jgi:hypothetical protein
LSLLLYDTFHVSLSQGEIRAQEELNRRINVQRQTRILQSEWRNNVEYLEDIINDQVCVFVHTYMYVCIYMHVYAFKYMYI